MAKIVAQFFLYSDKININKKKPDQENGWTEMILVNQFQDLAGILYRAAEEGSQVDPNKVEQILGVPQTSSKMERVAEEISGRYYILFTLYTDSLLINCRFLPSILV